MPTAPSVPAAADPALPGPIAGTITAEASELDTAIAGWLDHLRAIRRAPNCIAVYRQVVAAATREMGWSAIADIGYAGVSTYLASRGGWSAATYNRNASVFRSLSAWMHRSGLVAADPLEHLERAEHAYAPGSRAATLGEAMAMVRTAWARQIADGRARNDRALYWAMLFGAGLRVGEPARLTRGDLALDEDVPVIVWRDGAHKARRSCEVAIAPWLAGLLHRRLREVPGGDKDPLFTRVPPRCQFRRDRDLAGIAPVDRRGQRFSPHSARKYFATALTGLNVPPRLVDALMRHRAGTPARYYDPTPAEQFAAVAVLPDLWPTGLDTARRGGHDDGSRWHDIEDAMRSSTTDRCPPAAQPAASRANDRHGEPSGGRPYTERPERPGEDSASRYASGNSGDRI